MRNNPLTFISVDLEVTGEKSFAIASSKECAHLDGAILQYFSDTPRPKLTYYVLNSIIAIGACAINYTKSQWEISRDTFYRELKPLSLAYNEASMRIACKGLKCRLDPEFYNHDGYRTPNFYNPEHEEFDSRKFLECMVWSRNVEHAKKGIPAFEKFIMRVTPQINLPVLLAAPVRFDARPLDLYFDLFGTGTFRPYESSSNPLGYTGYDLQSFYRGSARNLFADIRDLGLRKGGELTHNALEDAVQQATEFVEVLKRNNIQGVPPTQGKS